MFQKRLDQKTPSSTTGRQIKRFYPRFSYYSDVPQKNKENWAGSHLFNRSTRLIQVKFKVTEWLNFEEIENLHFNTRWQPNTDLTAISSMRPPTFWNNFLAWKRDRKALLKETLVSTQTKRLPTSCDIDKVYYFLYFG